MIHGLAFLVLGLVLGTAVPFPIFAIVTVVALGLDAAFDPTRPAAAMLRDRLLPAALALQVGYFVAVAIRVALERRRRTRQARENRMPDC